MSESKTLINPTPAMSTRASMVDEPTPLFQSVLNVMKMAEKSGTDGPTKRQVVVNVLIGAGLIKEADREHILVIIDLIIYCAKNADDLKAFAKSNCCLPCLPCSR